MPRNERSTAAAHAIVGLSRERLGEPSSLYFAPDIPPRKEAAARRAHADHLPEDEPILVLYDATIFGGADEGFVITPERLCWRNFLENARQIAWEDVEVASIVPDGAGVRVAGGRIMSVGPMAKATATLFREIVTRGEMGRAGPYRAAAGVPSPEPGSVVSRLVALARRHLGEVDGIYYFPSIPLRKHHNARTVHADHLAEGEEVAVLYDDTLFGSAEEGFLLTPARLCWKNLATDPEMLTWSAVDPNLVTASGNAVSLMGHTIHVATYPERSLPVATLIAAIAREQRSHRDRGET
ncbi:Hypothetical protein A7982_09323 [Minicystis rosea]|nr:Hypothetical protein A7982_09323 [Minicystis rosea]